ncbi:AAA domain-containing protein [Acetobacterium paludosum]|uniref:magnesium chelatase n=1 Tax=Acetobacterium paludosum TaxID=52693 RepID=A0A923HWG6_9FIRM|nr:ATP-binding protein [Acetobacterium paludosum]MBC3887874.1 AAA domain-containing protein [Acetobacterium paludosum]
MKKNRTYPFTAIIGQESMKMGLILNVIDPKIGGVLVFGEKGTGKSTAVRAIANLLPEIDVVKDCPFRCDPNDPGSLCENCREKVKNGETLAIVKDKMRVVDLPVSATEDRVVGSLDIEEAIQHGKKKFDLGVLAQANRGILYVDEINLLDDHIVDLLLDSAAMGVNTVEREGISFSHPAQFILVGTMNPEEGELRPQLLDRFGFSVDIKGIKDPRQRIDIVKRRGAFEADPHEFMHEYQDAETQLSDQIVKARERLPEVTIDDDLLLTNAKIAIALEVDGHRGDLTLMKAARAMAAYKDHQAVDKEDIREVTEMVFLHRLKSLPFETTRKFNMAMVNTIIDDNGATVQDKKKAEK